MGSHGNGANQLSHGDLLISRELIESTLELIADRLVLLLDQVGFKFITFLLEFSGLSLALSGASLSVLESGAEIANGLLVRLFAGKGLSLGNFEGLHVVADDLQLFLQLLDLGFSVISALLGALKIHLQHRQTSGGLVILEAQVLKHFATSLGLIGCLGGLFQLLGGDSESLFGSLEIFLNQLAASLERRHLSLRLLDLLVGGFEVGVGGGEIFCGGVEVVLNLLDLLVQGVDLIVTLFEVALELP